MDQRGGGIQNAQLPAQTSKDDWDSFISASNQADRAFAAQDPYELWKPGQSHNNVLDPLTNKIMTHNPYQQPKVFAQTRPIMPKVPFVIFEDNQAVIKILQKGRPNALRHINRTHRVSCDL